jgi:alpha-L-fucosidase
VAIDPDNGTESEVEVRKFDISRDKWKVLLPADSSGATLNMIDENPQTFWAPEKSPGPREVIIDLGQVYPLEGFTFWPMQERWAFGLFTDYDFYTSLDNRNWTPVASGEFSNIVNNPIEQTITFNKSVARFIKLKASNIQGEEQRASFAEIGVLTAKE